MHSWGTRRTHIQCPNHEASAPTNCSHAKQSVVESAQRTVDTCYGPLTLANVVIMQIVKSSLELSREGVGRNTRERQVRLGHWKRLSPGRYLTNPDASPLERWLSELHQLQRSCSEQAVVSHRSAAILHGFDGFRLPNEFGRIEPAWPVDLTTPHNIAKRTFTLRSRKQERRDNWQLIGNLWVTSPERTLLDLGSVVEPNLLELALESAIRGTDPRKPHHWNRELLDRVVKLSKENPLAPGIACLQEVLGRRPIDTHPTGSIAETFALQGMRAYGLGDLERQAEIRIVDQHGRLRVTFYADFGGLDRGLLVEIDGTAGHSGEDNMQRDDRRQNLLHSVFTVVRFRAAVALHQPQTVGLEASRLWNSLNPQADPLKSQSYLNKVTRTPTGYQITLEFL
jgi:very-short-patch-repair endonuclease